MRDASQPYTSVAQRMKEMTMRQSLMTLGAATFALALTATPVLASQTISVQYRDLDLNTPAGKTELEKRIAKAAAPLCRDDMSTGTRLSQTFCKSQVRRLVHDEIAQRDYRSNKGG